MDGVMFAIGMILNSQLSYNILVLVTTYGDYQSTSSCLEVNILMTDI